MIIIYAVKVIVIKLTMNIYFLTWYLLGRISFSEWR